MRCIGTKLVQFSLLSLALTLAIGPAAASTTVPAGTISVDTTWDLPGSPYIVEGNLIIAGTDGLDNITTLTIEPGVEVRFALNAQLMIGDYSASPPGALYADGGTGGGAATITFTADTVSPSAGYWKGIHFRRGASDTSYLRNVAILYAGGYANGALRANHETGVTILVDDVTILDSASYGFELYSGTLDVLNSTAQGSPSGDVRVTNTSNVAGSFDGCTLESVSYTGNLAQPISWANITAVNYGAVTSRFDPDDLGVFMANATITSVPDAVTEVIAGAASRDGTWTLAGSPYVVLGLVTVRGESSVLATITIEPGVELRFNSSTSGLTVGGNDATEPGALIADGDAGGPVTIVLTANSETPTPGMWRGVITATGMHASTVLRNVDIRYPGYLNYGGVHANHASGTTLTIDRVTVSDSSSYGIRVQSGDASVTGCSVQGSPTADVNLGSTANVSATFTGNTLGSVVYSGVYANPITWSNNTFVDYGAVPSRIDPDDLGDFLATATFASKAPGAVTEVIAGTAGRSGTWTLAGSPYALQGSVTIKGAASVLSAITIEPGVELRVASASNLTIGSVSATEPGALIADGNAGTPATILFTADSPSPTPGFWQGLTTRASTDASTVLRNVEIRYGGSSIYGGVYANHASGTTITLDQTTIHDSAAYGIRVYAGGVAVTDSTIQDNGLADVRFNSSASVSGTFAGNTLGSISYAGTSAQPIAWTNTTFVDYGAVTSRIDPDDLAGLLATATFSSKVPEAVTEILAGTATVSGTWTLDASPYHVLGLVKIEGPGGPPAVITIAPGVEMRFDPLAGIDVATYATSPGALIADGDASGGPATIVFTSSQPIPAPGDWRGINLRTGTESTTVLRNVDIGYAGSSTSVGGVTASYDAAVSVTVDRATIHDSATWAVRVTSGQLQVSDSVLADSDKHDVGIVSASAVSATFTGNTLESVRYEGSAQGPIAWTGNTFDNWGATTSKVRLADLDEFTRANTFNPVPGAVLEVFTDTVDVDTTWSPAAGPLLIDNSFRIQGTDGIDGVTTLTLEPGVTVRVPEARWIYVGGGSGDPGELIADGAPGGIYDATINLNVDTDVPDAGSWNGLRIDETGRAQLRHVQVRYAGSGVLVYGTLAASSNNVTVNRSNIGLELFNGVVEDVLRGWSFRNCGIGVQATGTVADFRESNLFGSTWGVENLSPGTHCIDAEGNYWDADDGPSGSPPAVGCETATPTGTGAAITEGVLFASYLGETPDDGDTIVCDDGDGFPDPCSDGNTVGCDDNCCEVANDSQADEDGDGVGDACDDNPVLRVSSDPADLPDFAIVQDAVDASAQSGTRVEILPGFGPYNESVRLDRSQVYSFVGITNVFEDPIVIDGNTGPAFRVINKVGTVPMVFAGLTLRGGQGIRTSVDVAVEDCVFDDVANEALQLDVGVHTVDHSTFGPFLGTAARLETGVSLEARRVDVRGASDAGFVADGPLVLENALIAGGADGVRLGVNGSLDASYVTIADNTGVGIDASVGGTVISVDRSIVHGNALDDVVGAPCTVMWWSDSGSPDCSGVNDNLSADPLLEVDYHLDDGSPCLDHGPDPAGYTGDPASDLDGGVRIADYDGDGFAVNDCGAYERVNATLVPGAVTGLRWDFNFRLLWDAEPDAVEYHVYRDLLANLGYTSFGVCRNDLDLGGRTDTQLDDTETPTNPGDAFFYLITAEATGGDEGTLGFGTSAERSNFNACP